MLQPTLSLKPLALAISSLLAAGAFVPSVSFAADLKLALPQVTIVSSEGMTSMQNGENFVSLTEGDTVRGQISVVPDEPREVPLAAQTCNVSFDLVVSNNRAIHLGDGDDFAPVTNADYQLDGVRKTIAVTIDDQGMVSASPQAFELTLVADAEEEDTESYGLYADNVTTTCGEEGGYSVSNLEYNDGAYGGGGLLYGTLLNKFFAVVEPEPEVPTVPVEPTVGIAILTTKAQLQTATTIALQNARTRHQNIASELARRRSDQAGFSTHNLALNLKGQGVNLGALGGAAGDAPSRAWSGFVSGNIEVGEASQQTIGFDFDSNLLTAGVDYRAQQWVVGAALTLANAQSQYNQGGQAAEVEQQGFSAFASLFSEHYYLNLIASQSRNDFDFARRQGVVSVAANTGGDELSFAIGGGYERTINHWNVRTFFILDDATVDVDGYTESASSVRLSVASFKRQQQSLELGGLVNYTLNTQVGVMQPFVQVSYRDITKGNHWSTTAQYSGDEGSGTAALNFNTSGGDYWVGQVGLSAVFPYGIAAYMAYQQEFARKDWDISRYDLGLRWEF